MGISILQSTMSKSPNSVEVYKGASKDIELEVKRPDVDVDGNSIDVPFDLTGCVVYFCVRKDLNGPKALILKTSASPSEIVIASPTTLGRATIIISYTDTKFMDPGKYYFDVWVKKPDGKRFPVIEPSEFVILPAVNLID